MQEVNLLSAELTPHKDPFTFREFAMAWGLLALLLTVVSGWQAYSVWQDEQSLVTAMGALAESRQEVALLQSTTKRQADPALLQQLAQLTAQQLEQRQLASALDTEHMNAGFNGHLSDLASIDMRDLWFESIALEQGGQQIHLSGFSASAERVPLFLSMLSKGQSFSGYRFDGLQIKRETEKLVSFDVRGPLAGEEL